MDGHAIFCRYWNFSLQKTRNISFNNSDEEDKIILISKDTKYSRNI
jgi:hypothetical protein